MKVRHWKAFLRLSGDSLVDRDEEILAEFKGFAQSLKRIGIDYSIILQVENRAKSSSTSREQLHSTIHDPSATMGGD